MHAIIALKMDIFNSGVRVWHSELQGTPGFDMGFCSRLEIRMVGTLMSCLELPPSQFRPIFLSAIQSHGMWVKQYQV